MKLVCPRQCQILKVYMTALEDMATHSLPVQLSHDPGFEEKLNIPWHQLSVSSTHSHLTPTNLKISIVIWHEHESGTLTYYQIKASGDGAHTILNYWLMQFHKHLGIPMPINLITKVYLKHYVLKSNKPEGYTFSIQYKLNINSGFHMDIIDCRHSIEGQCSEGPLESHCLPGHETTAPIPPKNIRRSMQRMENWKFLPDRDSHKKNKISKQGTQIRNFKTSKSTTVTNIRKRKIVSDAIGSILVLWFFLPGVTSVLIPSTRAENNDNPVCEMYYSNTNGYGYKLSGINSSTHFTVRNRDDDLDDLSQCFIKNPDVLVKSVYLDYGPTCYPVKPYNLSIYATHISQFPRAICWYNTSFVGSGRAYADETTSSDAPYTNVTGVHSVRNETIDNKGLVMGILLGAVLPIVLITFIIVMSVKYRSRMIPLWAKFRSWCKNESENGTDSRLRYKSVNMASTNDGSTFLMEVGQSVGRNVVDPPEEQKNLHSSVYYE
jgi:hypothetical protein